MVDIAGQPFRHLLHGYHLRYKLLSLSAFFLFIFRPMLIDYFARRNAR